MNRDTGDIPYVSSSPNRGVSPCESNDGWCDCLSHDQKEDETPLLAEVDKTAHKRHNSLDTRFNAVSRHIRLLTCGRSDRRGHGGASDNCIRQTGGMENDGSEGVDVLWSTLSEADVEAVTKLETLVPGTIFADRYRIVGGKGCQKMQWRRAMDVQTSKPVWLKFCVDAAAEWNNAIHIHELLHENRHICRLLGVIHDDRDGFPPFSVCEAGDCTLAETIAPGRLDTDQQRSILRAIAVALESLHRQGIVHGDVNPANVVWFSSDGWKLTNLERARRAGEEAPLDDCCNKYEAPEIMQALTEGSKVIRRTLAQDLWSFGRIASEMCINASVFDAISLQEGMRSQVAGTAHRGEAFQRWRSGQQEESGVRFIDSLLREDPNERQTSRQILDDDFLRPVADDGSSAHPSESPQRNDRYAREDVHQYPALPWGLILNIGMTAKACVECFLRSSDPSLPFHQRPTQEALRFFDEYLPRYPVHILRLEHDNLLRFHVTLNRHLPFVAEKALVFRVKPPDEDFVELEMTEHRQGQGMVVIGHLAPSKFTSNKMHVISPYFGLVDRKYVKLTVHVKVQVNGPFRREVDLYQLIYVKIVHPRARLILHRMLGMFENQDQHDINA